jgi:dethiobiotin synthase
VNGFFVTGTDTGVGKTVVTAALVASARARGLDAVPMKPVQTGCLKKGKSHVATDLEFALSMSDLHPTQSERERMAPYCYQPACSPHLAARLARRPIRINRIHSIAQRLQRDHDALIVEGAGGILVPINGRRTQLDIMTRLELPVILVSRPELGTLNHTLLSVKRLQDAGLNIAGIVMVCTTVRGNCYIEDDNQKTLREFTGISVLGPLPFMRGLNANGLKPQSFLRRCEPILDKLVSRLARK